jgi:adenosylhomocysteine nucleosidase
MRTIYVSATKLEHGVHDINGEPVYIVGTGKIVSAINTTTLIKTFKPDRIVNFGSCGNLKNHKIGDVLEVGSVVNDIDARPFAEYGETPFFGYSTLKLGDSPIKCFTTDYFYNSRHYNYSPKYMEMIRECDIVDMELYSIALACKIHDVTCRSFKWVSDNGNGDDWKVNAAIGFETFLDKLKNKTL